MKKGIKRFIETIRGEYVIDKERDRDKYLRSIRELTILSIDVDRGFIENVGYIDKLDGMKEGSFMFEITPSI